MQGARLEGPMAHKLRKTLATINLIEMSSKYIIVIVAIIVIVLQFKQCLGLILTPKKLKKESLLEPVELQALYIEQEKVNSSLTGCVSNN